MRLKPRLRTEVARLALEPLKQAGFQSEGIARPDVAAQLQRRKDPPGSTNLWADNTDEGSALFKDAIAFLRACGTADKFVKPREDTLQTFTAVR